MKNIITIAGREIKSAFVTPLAYVVISGFVLLSAFFFFSLLAHFNVQIGQAALLPNITPSLNEWVVAPYYQTLEVVLIFLVPVLTMRAIAEERRSGTFELVLTSPLSVSEIILGKFLGISAVVLIMILFSFMYPLALIIYADPETLPILTGLLGLLLFAFSFVSLGIAVSAFARSQAVAGVLGIVLLLMFDVLDAPAKMLGGRWTTILKFIAPSSHAEAMLKGLVTGSDLAYFVSVMLLGLFVAGRALDAQRWR